MGSLIEEQRPSFYGILKVKVLAENQSGLKIKKLRIDRGGEFTSTKFNSHCEENGIGRQLTTSYTSQQNNVVKRRNQTIVSIARCLLKSQEMAGQFWGKVVDTSIYLLNRAPTKSIVGMTPYKSWYNDRPSVAHLRTFGSLPM